MFVVLTGFRILTGRMCSMASRSVNPNDIPTRSGAGRLWMYARLTSTCRAYLHGYQTKTTAAFCILRFKNIC